MRFELETAPHLSDQELLYRIEHHLFGEMTSNITYGFEDEVLPLTLEEQKTFFERQDVREGMRDIILEIFGVTREEEEGYEDDFYRELIYEGSIGRIYNEVQASRTKVDENCDEVGNTVYEELAYEDYTPQFGRRGRGRRGRSIFSSSTRYHKHFCGTSSRKQ